MDTSEGNDGTSGRGMFEGFDAYLTVTDDDYRRLFKDGLVVPDTNVLLNLYRYTAEARDDLFAVLERLRMQLWVPHQVLVEFWRNRESILRDPRDTTLAIHGLTRDRDRSLITFITWANRISLSPNRCEELSTVLTSGFDKVIAAITELAADNAMDTAQDTNDDPILSRLGGILESRVGPPMSDPVRAAARKEARRRIDERLPPGYMDKNKGDEEAPGDYFIWEQILLEASACGVDVLLVTGDTKDDWWRRTAGEHHGPRPELANEFNHRTGKRLYILRPASLMRHVRALLGVTIRDESVEDVDRIEHVMSERPGEAASEIWAAGQRFTESSDAARYAADRSARDLASLPAFLDIARQVSQVQRDRQELAALAGAASVSYSPLFEAARRATEAVSSPAFKEVARQVSEIESVREQMAALAGAASVSYSPLFEAVRRATEAASSPFKWAAQRADETDQGATPADDQSSKEDSASEIDGPDPSGDSEPRADSE